MRKILIMLATAVIAAGSALDLTTYWGFSGRSWTAAVDPVAAAGRYEWQLFSPERNLVLLEDSTAGEQFTFALPAAGHAILRVRACAGETCSGWSESTDPAAAVVDGAAKGWWIYGYLAPPGGIDFGS